MAYIDPAPSEKMEAPKLKEFMAVADDLGLADEQFFEVLAHAPNYGEALFNAMRQAYVNGGVDVRVKEAIRIQLARLAGDEYFASLRSKKAMKAGLTEELIDAACGDFDKEPAFTDAHKWAFRYGYLMYREPGKVNKEFYEEGKKHYSEAEILELGNYMTINFGMQSFIQTLKLIPVSDLR
jgi:alkylhydroperoxidase family enzyme